MYQHAWGHLCSPLSAANPPSFCRQLLGSSSALPHALQQFAKQRIEHVRCENVVHSLLSCCPLCNRLFLGALGRHKWGCSQPLQKCLSCFKRLLPMVVVSLPSAGGCLALMEWTARVFLSQHSSLKTCPWKRIRVQHAQLSSSLLPRLENLLVQDVPF